MSSFRDSFEQDADHPDWYHAHADRPVMQTASVRFSLWGDGECAAEDDRECDEVILITAYCESENGVSSPHEEAWKYIKANTPTIEKELRRKLWAICCENFEEFSESLEPDDADWAAIENAANWKDASSLDVQVELTGISLFGHGFDEAGFCTFDFDIGWDEEHGLCILMHKDKVLAASCAADFTGRGSSILGHAKCIQEFAFTEGDYRIEG